MPDQQQAIGQDRFCGVANANRHPTLIPTQLAGQDVWYVQVFFPDGRCEQVGAFREESETSDWITRQSGAWLDDYERRRIERCVFGDPSAGRSFFQAV